MAEARRISHDANVKGYSSMDELKSALEDWYVPGQIYNNLQEKL